jgi:hypothetical protein
MRTEYFKLVLGILFVILVILVIVVGGITGHVSSVLVPAYFSFVGNPENYNKPEFWSAFGTIMAALATLFVVLRDPLRAYLNEPEVTVLLVIEPPHSHMIQLRNAENSITENALYVRCLVSHIKGKIAEDVEVFLSNVWEVLPEGRRVKEGFLPMNLKWSHFGTKEINIPPHTFRHCDLGSMRSDHNGRIYFIFDTIVQPNMVGGGVFPNILNQGSYEIELTVSGRNSNYINKQFSFSFGGTWKDNEKHLLSCIKAIEI